MSLEIESLHHVSVPVSDLDRARRFYSEVLDLTEIARPSFEFPGAWYTVGDRTVHLIVGERLTFRGDKGIDSRDIHFAIRVRSYGGAIAHLESCGYRRSDEQGANASALTAMRINPRGRAGFPQIYILDPDRNVIEINAEFDDRGA
jgi:glyoxylase I family protein